MAMNLHTTLQKFKISEAELNAINYFSNFKRTPQIDFYYKMFEKLLSEIEKNFKPHITYSLAKPSKADSYSYEFWLSKTALLSIRKQKDPNISSIKDTRTCERFCSYENTGYSS